MRIKVLCLLALFLSCTRDQTQKAETICPGVTVQRGAISRVLIETGQEKLAVYGGSVRRAGNVELLLLTHNRRDVLRDAVNLAGAGVNVVIPAAEKDQFLETNSFWADFAQHGRYHDYAQQSTKILIESIPVYRSVAGGETIQWQDLKIEVLDTPGYMRGAVSYFTEVDGKTIGFTGDLFYGDGQLFDLYSLQDAVPDLKIRGYHGYAARAEQLIQSLETVSRKNPDVLIPMRGPVIRNPAGAIARLIGRLRAVYANYLSINAGRWYFESQYDSLASRVLGASGIKNWIGEAGTVYDQPPDWIIPIENTRIILSESGAAFVLDCGNERIFNQIMELKKSGRIRSIDGLFITHYHDDHTDFIPTFVKKVGCPIYATEQSADILKNPQAYRYPAMTANPVEGIEAVKHGFQLRRHEFLLEFRYLPGQTLYHDALLVRKDNGEVFYFIGDSFSPTGIDDYCLLNRNLMHPKMGYLHCLESLSGLPAGTKLINQHIRQPFTFHPDQIEHMIDMYQKRVDLLSELFPWENPNFGIDEQWVRFYPYGQDARIEESFELSVQIMNHSDRARPFEVTLNLPEGFSSERLTRKIRIPAVEEKSVSFSVQAASGIEIGTHVITADVHFEDWELQDWCECLVSVK